MAAGQQRKRMNSANTVGFCSREHYRTKKKRIASPVSRMNTRYHISLDWDSNQNKVVAKREQVGLSLRLLRPFVDAVPGRLNILADVCSLPEEIFELENLSEVLSYEVWRSFLSEDERNYLQQFLPKGVDVEQVVQPLLDGDNFHFGNPFLDWGIAVCSGEFHPDGVLSQEERIWADKRRYYSELQKYHNEIIDYLQKLKEKWESCNDPEKEIATKMWGISRGDNADVTDGLLDLEQDLTAASESCSLGADEKPCSSDNKNVSVATTRAVQKRSKTYPKSTEKEKSENPSVALDNMVNIGAKARKKDKLPKHSAQQSDGAKYMSYLKISKKQHQIVTNMKQSDKSIQSRTLNRILGNIETLDVQPYGVFVEEEQMKLNAHWMQLAKDLPAAYTIWKKLRLLKHDIIKSVEGELKEKVNPWMEDDQGLDNADNALGKDDIHMPLRNGDSVKENQEILVPDQNNDLVPLQESDVEASGTSCQVSARHDSPLPESSDYNEQIRDSHQCLQLPLSPSQVSLSHCGNNVNLYDIEEKRYSFPCSPNSGLNIKGKETEADEYSCSLPDQSLPLASPASEHPALELNNIIPLGKNHVSEMENSSTVILEQSTDLRVPCIASNHEDSQFCSSGDVWQPVGGMAQSYIDRQAYTAGGGLSIMQKSQGEEGELKNCSIDLQSDVHKEDDRKDMLQRQLDHGSFSSFPNNNDQNELLQSLLKGQGVSCHNPQQLHSLLKGSHNEEHRQMMGINFQEPSNGLMDSGRFSDHFPDQIPPSSSAMAQDQQRQDHIYGQGSISGNIYCDERGFLMQQQDWETSSMQMGVTVVPQLRSGPLLSQNWQGRANTNGVGCRSKDKRSGVKRDERRVRGVSEAEQMIHKGSTSDQSLFSVLSQCSQLRRSLESSRCSEGFVAPSNYGVMMGGVVGSSLPEPANPLGYVSGSKAATCLMTDDVGWLNQTHHTSALHDPLGILNPRPWNQQQ